MKEQIKSREILLKRQKEMKHKINEQLFKEHQDFLKEEKQITDEKKKNKCYLRKYLNEQMKFREEKIVSLYYKLCYKIFYMIDNMITLYI